MPLFLDTHIDLNGISPEALSDAHQKDLATEKQYPEVHFVQYWYGQNEDGTVKQINCLVKAPSAEYVNKVHAEAHGVLADEVMEVKEGVPSSETE